MLQYLRPILLFSSITYWMPQLFASFFNWNIQCCASQLLTFPCHSFACSISLVEYASTVPSLATHHFSVLYFIGLIQTAALQERCSLTDDTVTNCPSWTVKRSFMMQRQVGWWIILKILATVYKFFLLYIFFSSATLTGLESDDSCEVSFKDAPGFESKQASNGCVRSENGVWERRYVVKCQEVNM